MSVQCRLHAGVRTKSQCGSFASAMSVALIMTMGVAFSQSSGEDAEQLSADSLETLVEGSEGAEESTLAESIEEIKKVIGGMSLQWRTRVTFPLQRSRGFVESAYEGSPIKSYSRIKLSHGETASAGILIEKDPGERSIANFLSGFVSMSQLGLVRTVVAGDYLVQAGQGLALWLGDRPGKTIDFSSLTRTPLKRIRPNTSAHEIAPLRGIAAEFSLDNFSLTFFFSSRSRPGTLDEHGTLTSFYTSGLFRTASELAKLGAIREKVMGSVIEVDLFNRIRFGGTIQSTAHSRPMNVRSSNESRLGSAFWEVRPSTRFTLSGECALNARGISAGILGVNLSPSQGLEIVSIFRHYSNDSRSLHGNSFRSNSLEAETGAFFGVSVKGRSKIGFTAYMDKVSGRAGGWTGFNESADDIVVHMSYRGISRTGLSLRFRNKIAKRGEVAADNVHGSRLATVGREKQTLRIEFENRVSPSLLLKSRIEGSRSAGHEGEPDHGLLCFQHLTFKLGSFLKFEVRCVLFQIRSFDAGIAVFENELPGGMSIPILHGYGSRWFMIIQWEPAGAITLSMRYLQHVRDDTKTLGSGLDQLPANRDERVGIQLDMTL